MTFSELHDTLGCEYNYVIDLCGEVKFSIKSFVLNLLYLW